MAKSNSSSRIIIVIIALGIAGYGLYLLNGFLKSLQKPTDNPSVPNGDLDPLGGGFNPTPTQTGNSGSSSGGSSTINKDKVLKVGSKGAEVKAFQTILNQIADKTNDPKISADGDYGKKTDAQYQKLSLNGSLFKATINEANRYLTTLSGGNVTTGNNWFYNPLDMATAIKAAINVSWWQNKCEKNSSMCDTLKKTYGQGTAFLLQVGREYQQRNDNKLSTDLDKYYNKSLKCTCLISLRGNKDEYSFEPDKIQSIIAQLKTANL